MSHWDVAVPHKAQDQCHTGTWRYHTRHRISVTLGRGGTTQGTGSVSHWDVAVPHKAQDQCHTGTWRYHTRHRISVTLGRGGTTQGTGSVSHWDVAVPHKAHSTRCRHNGKNIANIAKTKGDIRLYRKSAVSGQPGGFDWRPVIVVTILNIYQGAWWDQSPRAYNGGRW